MAGTMAKAVSGNETDTETATAYPPPIVGPFSDGSTKVVEWDAITMTFENENTTPASSYKWVKPDGSSDGRVDDGSRAFVENIAGQQGYPVLDKMIEVKTTSKATYTIAPGKMTVTRSREESHAFPSAPVKPCGCKDAAAAEEGGGGFDIASILGLVAPYLVSLFGGGKSPSSQPYPNVTPAAGPPQVSALVWEAWKQHCHERGFDPMDVISFADWVKSNPSAFGDWVKSNGDADDDEPDPSSEH